jgi:hypothetical protein
MRGSHVVERGIFDVAENASYNPMQTATERSQQDFLDTGTLYSCALLGQLPASRVSMYVKAPRFAASNLNHHAP